MERHSLIPRNRLAYLENVRTTYWKWSLACAWPRDCLGECWLVWAKIVLGAVPAVCG